MLPDLPLFTQKKIDWCRENNDFSPILFEWYKFVGGLSGTFSNFLQETVTIRNDISKRDYGILIGLINRCSRLILANVALSNKGKFGESTSILDRCIFESCVVLSWLCQTNYDDRFDQYVASGLRTELELKSEINKAIKSRNGTILNIEERMLNSVNRCIKDAELDDERIKTIKKFPDIASMLIALGYERFSYTIGQRLGSHHVHGTWVGLVLNFIKKDENGSYRTQQASPTYVDQYVYISNFVLDALSSFATFIFTNTEQKKTMKKLFCDTKKEINSILKEAAGTDFNKK